MRWRILDLLTAWSARSVDASWRVDLLVALATAHEKVLRLVMTAAVSLKFVC